MDKCTACWSNPCRCGETSGKEYKKRIAELEAEIERLKDIIWKQHKAQTPLDQRTSGLESDGE